MRVRREEGSHAGVPSACLIPGQRARGDTELSCISFVVAAFTCNFRFVLVGPFDIFPTEDYQTTNGANSPGHLYYSYPSEHLSSL